MAGRMVKTGLWCLVLLAGLWLVSSAWAHDGERAPAVHFTSDCLTGGVLVSEIKSYVTWPEPVKREAGEQYVLNLSTPNGIMQFCWKDQAAKDAAVAQVRQAFGQ